MIRSNPLYVESSNEPCGGYFQSVNRGKRSLELDLNDEEDPTAFLSLVDRADVVVESFEAGTMEVFDLGYERLRERNPGLIYSSIRGFGDPHTGESQYVDTAMYDAVVSLCERTVYQYSYTGEAPTRQGNSHPTLFPYDAFEASDGCVVIAAFSDGHWNGLCEAMDRPGLAADYADPASRMEAREQLRSEIASWMSEHRVETIVGELEGRVPAAPVQDIEDIFETHM